VPQFYLIVAKHSCSLSFLIA